MQNQYPKVHAENVESFEIWAVTSHLAIIESQVSFYYIKSGGIGHYPHILLVFYFSYTKSGGNDHYPQILLVFFSYAKSIPSEKS